MKCYCTEPRQAWGRMSAILLASDRDKLLSNPPSPYLRIQARHCGRCLRTEVSTGRMFQMGEEISRLALYSSRSLSQGADQFIQSQLRVK